MYYWTPDYRQISYPYGMFPQAGMMQPGMTPDTTQFGYPQYPAGTQVPTVPTPSGGPFPLPMAPEAPAVPTAEESYIENILRFNRGKIGTFYFTYENNTQWNAKIYRGRVETAGRDHIIISDPQTGKRYLLLMVNLDYVEFDEPLAYIPPTLPPLVQQELTTGVSRTSEAETLSRGKKKP
ncbi:spore coat protein GerQ [Effusibacillus consociatus]|uniref:spore coat protein GerQ n=1 Tax=Effusibacillus consociatus TaxID=1117041 RepID=UPI0036D21DA3